MNGYVCFYKQKRIEVRAESTYAAQKKAAEILRVSERNRYKITVTLAEKDGQQIVHSPLD